MDAIQAGRTSALLLALLAATATAGAQQVDPQAALHHGNRLFRDGQIEAAVDAYLAGYSSRAPHPILLYNLGTALHHQGRLPEAILWYRRAAESDAGDPWLEDNLWLARRGLGSQNLPPGDPLGWLRRHAGGLRLAAVALAWLSLLVVVAAPKMPAWWLAAAALLATSAYGGATAVERWGPRPAVLLEDCLTGSGELPAGTEAWVRRTTGDQWQIAGAGDAACPAEAVGLVAPHS
jgi:tetratricopeptide (TPR) repeat protein